MSIVERIKKSCKENGTSMNALEKELGLGNGTIRLWDTKEPGSNKVIMVAERLGLSLDYILTGKEAGDLTPEEQQLVDLYRQADERGKRSILRLAQDEARELESLISGTGSTGTDS